jgi:pyruvate dehydrogenase E2 component (dihydrolipoamide acetyltransferase)
MSKLIPITIPKWGIEMKKGTVGTWLVDIGGNIVSGDEIVEIETDKITNSFEATADGVLVKIIAEPGEELPVGQLIGVMADGEASDDEINAFVENYDNP